MKLVPASEQLADYLGNHATALSRALNAEQINALEELRAETLRLPGSEMQISREQGAFLYLLSQLCQARRILELGRYTGYSTICFAAALPADGRIVTIDRDTKTLPVAERFFAKTGQSAKIEIRTGLALEILRELETATQENFFDLAFIDADKAPMQDYFEACLRLVRSGGLILLDNTLWSGEVADESKDDKTTKAIRDCNQFIAGDPRVECVLLNIADGILVARKITDGTREVQPPHHS